MADYLPDRIFNDELFSEVYNTNFDEILDSKLLIEDLLNQRFVDMATWGLKFWERFLNIPIDENKPYEYRRSVIKSKMRGIGNVTVDLIKIVANAYQNGEVEVIDEYQPNAFALKFISEIGTPLNLNDLKNAIDEIKPAHLQVFYLFRYITVYEINQMTITQLNNTILDKFAGGLIYGRQYNK